MRLIIIFFALACCTNKSEFEEQFNQLREIKLPINFTSRAEYHVSDDSLSYAVVHGHDYGRLFKEINYYATIRLIPTETFTPALYTFDPNGKVIDSFTFFRSPGGEPGFLSVETVSINKNKTFTFIDSTQRWETDSLYAEIMGTRKIEVVKEKYAINNDGKIVKVD